MLVTRVVSWVNPSWGLGPIGVAIATPPRGLKKDVLALWDVL